MASGIFPHITKELIKHCCSKSKITYAKLYPTITKIKDNIEHDSAIDISYPVYGMDICFKIPYVRTHRGLWAGVAGRATVPPPQIWAVLGQIFGQFTCLAFFCIIFYIKK